MPDSFITITSGMSGYFAVHMTWNDMHGGFYEPWDTGFGRYATKEEAIEEAKEWAKSAGITYRE